MPAYDPFKPIHLQHPHARLRASVIPFGLTIQSLTLDSADGGEQQTDLIVAPQNPKDHLDAGRNFFGPVIGRFANRLPAGNLKLDLADGQRLNVDVPEFSAGGVSLHGGPAPASLSSPDSIEQKGPFDRAIWQHVADADSQLFFNSGYTSQPGAESPASSAIFAIESPHGDNGYPGRLRVEVLVAVLPASAATEGETRSPLLGTSEGSFLIRYRAKILDDVAATPLNLTQHWGFNLSSSSTKPEARSEQGRIDKHIVQLYPVDPAKGVKRLGLDAKMIADGTVIDLSKPDDEGQRHDWDAPDGKVIDHGRLSSGYDHFYVWGPAGGLASSDAADLCHERARRMRVTSDTTGISLTFHSNQAGTQIYCTEGQPPAPAPADKSGGEMKYVHRRNVEGEGKLGNGQRSAIMIEFGAPHCGFLHSSLEQWGGGASLLKKGEVYDNWVTCQAWQK
ncbi:uncharacterized protein PFL1_01577 [Pseudozyma flocculosa PF-1]|uniref:Aldose 1-epimerase n=1 Tax=Pseudozyma flocculosa TaxID=84751 RepID=A0A5C3EY14_9BASI|nr:uncharacterized protein PFL1_01577 [Pseudozyma flocculosa PF-1]EPQ30676.1 hypothetical protein PFL1_01577 [Pseudozyma flocculosa PF-1]SPO36992.1 uncharacterized protein PSFLO_02464 [Pseudozyma flocculosa]